MDNTLPRYRLKWDRDIPLSDVVWVNKTPKPTKITQMSNDTANDGYANSVIVARFVVSI